MSGNSPQKPDLAETVVRPANDGSASPEASLPADDVRENALLAFSDLSELDRARVQWVLDVSDSVLMVQAASAAGSNQTEIAVSQLARAREGAAERFAAYVKTHSADEASPLRPDELLMIYARYMLRDGEPASISVSEFADYRAYLHADFADARAPQSQMSDGAYGNFIQTIEEDLASLNGEIKTISENIKNGVETRFTQGDLVTPWPTPKLEKRHEDWLGISGDTQNGEETRFTQWDLGAQSLRRPKPEKRNQDWMAKASVVVLLAAALGAGGYLLRGNKNTAPDAPQPETPQQAVTTSAPAVDFAALCASVEGRAEELGTAMKAQGITPQFTYQPQIDSFRFTLERDGKTVCDLTLTPEQVNRIDSANPQASVLQVMQDAKVHWHGEEHRQYVGKAFSSALAVTPDVKISMNGQLLGAEHLGTVNVNSNLINKA